MVRRDGIAREQDEHRLGVSAVGAAVVVNGYAVGALSAAYASDAGPQPKITRAVRETAVGLARFLSEGLTPERLRWLPGPAHRLPGSHTPLGG